MSQAPRARILIVEDDLHIQQLLRYFLQPTFDLDVVTSVDDALREAAEKTYDLFLLDINLGEERTGADLLDALRRLPTCAKTPAMACTAYALQGDRERFLARGFEEHLDKPFTRQALSEAIEAALSGTPRSAKRIRLPFPLSS